MNNNSISLVDANRERAMLIAEAIVPRLSEKHNWQGWTLTEGLIGELRMDNVIVYSRPNHRDERTAMIAFIDPILKELKDVSFGIPITTESNVQERFSDVIKNDTDAPYTETISHQFSKTQSLSQAFKIAAELAIKTTAGVEYSGVKAGVEVSAKLSAEYNRQWSEETTTTDTVSKTITVPPRTYLDYQAVRSIDKQQRLVSTFADFDYTIQFVSAPGEPPAIFYKWGSVEEFIAITKGFASQDRDGYDLFINNRLDDNAIDNIQAPSDKLVEFIAEYDNVTSQKIVLKDKND